MCDYSMHNVKSRPAQIGDKLVTAKFPGTMTRGFAAVDDPAVAICLRPGAELVFERRAEYRSTIGQFFPFLRNKVAGTLARFRRINDDQLNSHHDALEFADGRIILLTHLAAGQRASVLQMPREQDPNRLEGQKHAVRQQEIAEVH